jgi:hypothetical protein
MCLRSSILFFSLIALFISLFLEITLFNYTHYATLFTSEQFKSNGLEFKNLNTEVASIHIEPVFLRGNTQRVRITWADEESSERSIDVRVVKGLDFSNYITITPRGKVSNLTIVFFENNIDIKQVELNKEIPMAIMPIRLVIVFAISLFLLCLKNIETREKISYVCFDYLYDKTNFRQRVGFVMLVCSMLIFNFLVSYSICEFKDNELLPKWLKMYSHNMTDALLKKQSYLDLEVSQALLEAERPYDPHYRWQHGISFYWDHSYYKGKYYSYFGIVPVITLFAPYKLLTGDYLPTSMGTFLFASIATVFLLLLWRQIAQNYLKKLPYFFFLIGGATLYASSLIPTFLIDYYFHLIAQYSGLAFVFLGLIMLLRARENLSIKYLIISSLSFALAVGCRPSALFWSIFIPVLLWDKRKELMNNSSKIFAIIVPFAIVGSILAWYNYVRFDSPFQFGTSYVITTADFTHFQIGIIGKIHSFIKAFLFAFFNLPNLDLTFPFVSVKLSAFPLAVTGHFISYGPIVGVFGFPITWFLFCVRKVNILRNFIFVSIFISLLNIALFSVLYSAWRYNLDFYWIMAMCALICASQLQEKETEMRKVILKTFYSLSIITLLLVFFLTISYRMVHGMTWNGREVISHYLARTFGVICNVP